MNLRFGICYSFKAVINELNWPHYLTPLTLILLGNYLTNSIYY
jgi:hypothetical protein